MRKTGGFPAVRHNEVRDITASMLTEVCHGVATELHLQLLTGETMIHRSVNTEAGARLDVARYVRFLGRSIREGIFGCEGFQPQCPIESTGFSGIRLLTT